jgi:hypothetical protein
MDTLTISLENKPLSAIAEIIRTNWVNPSPYAVPYVDAMAQLQSINESYYADTAQSVVIYFLANAQTWRGDTARLVKAHLKGLVK